MKDYFNKTDFIKFVTKVINNNADESSDKVTQKTVKLVCDGIEDVLYQLVTTGIEDEDGIKTRSLRYPNIGTISVVEVAEREMNDPNTNTKVTVPAHLAAKFKMSTHLKKAPRSL